MRFATFVFLGALALAGPAFAADDPSGDYVQQPPTFDWPTRNEIEAVWPSGVSPNEPGSAVVRCRPNVECEVLRETGGAGFGAAAVRLMTPGRIAQAAGAQVRLIFQAPVKRELDGSVYTLPQATVWPDRVAVYEAWPRAMRFVGVGQTVRLNCLIPAEGGRLRDCVVQDEGEPGRGFGGAALRLSELIVVRPGERDGRKTPVRQSFFIDFQCGCASEMMRWRLLDFEQTPSAAQITAVYPEGALARNVSGAARIGCKAAKGTLSGCKIQAQTDPELGFGEAALKLAPLYRVERPRDVRSEPVATSYTVVFNAPLPPTPTTPTEPFADGFTYTPAKWLKQPDGPDIHRHFPERALRLEKSGRVLLSCQPGAEYKMDDCKIIEETPTELGFGEAALKIAHIFRFSPELIDGKRTESAIRVPINFQID